MDKKIYLIDNYWTKLVTIIILSLAILSPNNSQTLVDLNISVNNRVDAFYGTKAPEGKSAKFIVQKPGKAKFIYRGTVFLNHTINKIKFDFTGNSSSLLPGITVESNVSDRSYVKGKPFEYIWIQEFAKKDVGMEIGCWVGPCHDYGATIGASYPPQDVQLLIEWIGDKSSIHIANTDLSGTWVHGSQGQTWTFIPIGNNQYTATEKGVGDARGIATVTGKKILINYTTKAGIKGSYNIVISSDGKSANGTWQDASPASGKLSMIKIKGIESGSEIPLPVMADIFIGDWLGAYQCSQPRGDLSSFNILIWREGSQLHWTDRIVSEIYPVKFTKSIDRYNLTLTGKDGNGLVRSYTLHIDSDSWGEIMYGEGMYENDPQCVSFIYGGLTHWRQCNPYTNEPDVKPVFIGNKVVQPCNSDIMNLLGCWNSEETPGFHNMYFYSDGDQVLGTYGSAQNIGRLDNIYYDNETCSIKGKWHITNNTQHGTFNIQLNDSHFKGTWTFGNQSGDWMGIRGKNCEYLKRDF